MLQRITCSNCGKIEQQRMYYSESNIARLARLKTLCFDCAYWENYMQHPLAGTAVVSGGLWYFNPQKEVLYNKSRRTRKGIVLAHELKTGDVVYSTTYRLIAKIPKHIKTRLPDQYRFISEQTYSLLISRQCKECLAKGCWDRYYCFWYDAAKAEPNKPWNEVPSYHKPGDELCETFINKNEMYNINIEKQ
jgi:hypothetical protein